MKRVLLDENLPRKLRRDLHEFFVRTVQEENWTSFANGELLGRAQDRFDVLLTADRRLQYQQNLAQFHIGVVVVLTVTLQYKRIRVAIEEIRRALAVVDPGQLLHVQIP